MRFDILSEEIHKYYLVLSQQTVGKFENPKVLKTDCWNETENGLPEGGIIPQIKGKKVLIEYQQSNIESAKRNYPQLNIVKGDIRKLPFADLEFDVILDLSTLDHIPEEDIEKALKEYNRVLKDGGYLLLITWFGKDIEYKEWTPDNQYNFNRERFNSIFKKYFILEKEEELWGDEKKLLTALSCIKNWRT